MVVNKYYHHQWDSTFSIESGGFASSTDSGYLLNRPTKEPGTTATKMKAARRQRKVLKGQNYLQLRGKY
jgi:hypothetical protein